MGYLNDGSHFPDNLPPDVAERVLSFLPEGDVARLRLVNRHWRELANHWVRRLRLQSLGPFSQGQRSLAELYPRLQFADLSSIDVIDDAQLKHVSDGLAKLPDLTELILRCGSQVSRRGFELLAGGVPQLKRLGLPSYGAARHGCAVNEAPSLDLDVVPFACFRNLTELDLSWNVITVRSIQSVASLPELEVLSLKHCLGVDDSIVEVLTTMASLRVLNLTSANITDDGLMTMNELGLEVLKLTKCEGITDDGMYWLKHIPTLRKVDISSCPGIASAGVEQLTNLPNLTDLYMQDNKQFGSSVLKRAKQLTKISVRDCSWMTNDMLRDLIGCKNLQSINLRNCNQITDAGLVHLLELPSLISVNLRGCSQITDAGLQTLSALPMMEDLDLSFQSQITDVGLKSLAKLTGLRRLILNWCNLITSDGLHELQASCKQLTELSIKGCHNMQFTDLVSMASLCSAQKLDYEHSLCSVHTRQQKQELPLLRHIDSVGCFVEIC